MATDLVFPTIFLLPAHFEADELPEIESQIPTLTYDINEAEVVLGKVSKKPRAILELRFRQLITDEIQPTPSDERDVGNGMKGSDDGLVQVVRLTWFTDSLAKGKVLPVDDYLVYQGRKRKLVTNQPVSDAQAILKRARDDDTRQRPASQSQYKHTNVAHHPRSGHPKRPRLVQETTSEHKRAAQLPPIPDYLLTEYSCQRPTPKDSPNDIFIEQLKKMRTIRTLESDDVGVRAYSTSIAAVAAYPRPLSSAAGKTEKLSSQALGISLTTNLTQ